MSDKSRRPAKVPVALAAAAVLALALNARPALATDFYAGKSVDVVIGTGVTGGFNIYARLIGRHIGRYLPGEPTIVPKNMPGAGSAIAGGYLFRTAPKDGTVIGALMPNAILGQLLDAHLKVRFDPRKFQYLAGAEHGTRVCMTMQNSKIKTYDDALKQKAIIGATAAGGSTRDYAAWHKNATGAKFEIVSGYKGPGDLFLAMERGEIDGICGLDWTALKSQKPEWIRDKKLNILVQDGIDPEPELTAMGVPQPWKYIKDPIDRKAVELVVGFQQAFGKAYLAPPGTPPEQVKILRKAFSEVLRDKGLLKDAKQVRVVIAPQSGEDIQRVVNALYAAPPEVIQRVKTLVTP